MTEKQTNPFVGLRPFRKDESHLFFGREEQVNDILPKLISNRMVTILGNSGAGKSSFVYCSLLPMLDLGYEINEIANWKCFSMYPGTINPLHRLVESLGLDGEAAEEAIENIERDQQSIIEVLKTQYSEKSNILIFIDQFEELFRVDRKSLIPEFLDLILFLVKQTELNVYVLITIRSDLIGYCSEYPTFTKKMNKGQYLLPRMTTEQKRRAIINPATLVGAEISDELVDRLLKDEKSDIDQLPVMQHALMRTWNYWQQTGGSRTIGVWEYEAIGTMSQALSIHANEVFSDLSPDRQVLAEQVFRVIAINKEGRAIRNPERISNIAEIADYHNYDGLFEVINAFRQEGRSFILPSVDVELEKELVIDISHESLIRIWDLLKTWIEKEQEAVKQYVRLAEKSTLYQEGKVSRLTGAELQLILNWRNEEKPTKEWAIRHHPAYENAMLFLDYCNKKEELENKRKAFIQRNKIMVQRLLVLVFLIIGVLGILFGFWAYEKKIIAGEAKKKAEQSAELARQEKHKAEEQRKLAEAKTIEAIEANKMAKKQQLLAFGQAIKANKAKDEADEQRKLAENSYWQAVKAEKQATKAKDEAVEQKKEAQEQREIAEKLFFQAESKALSVKALSTLIDGDKGLAATLALHSYFINNENEGPEQIESIYKALNNSLKANTETNDIPNIHAQGVSSIAYNKSNNTFVTTGNEGSIKIWNSPSGNPEKIELLSEAKSDDRITKIRFVKSENIMAATSANKLLIYNIADNVPTLTSSYKANSKSELKYFNYHTFNEKLLFSVINDDNVLILKQEEDKIQEIVVIPKNGSNTIITKIEGKRLKLILPNNENQLLVLSIALEEPFDVDTVKIVDVQKKITAISLSPNKRIIALGTSKGAIEIRNADNFAKITELSGHKGYVTDLKFNPTNFSQIASASLDKTVRLWLIDDEKNEPIKLETELWSNEVEFTPDGNYLISVGEDRTLRLWPTKAEIIAQKLCNHTKPLSEEELKQYMEQVYKYETPNCLNQTP